jgi:hypothetical protein
MGERIYPIALNKYGTLAPKLTGMVLDAIFKTKYGQHQNVDEIFDSVEVLEELVSLIIGFIGHFYSNLKLVNYCVIS